MAEQTPLDPTIESMAKRVTDDGGKLKTMIAELKKQYRDFVQSMDITAASVACHARLHGQITPINDFLSAINAGAKAAIRTNAYVAWLEKYAPVIWNAETEQMVFDRSRAKAMKKDYEHDKLAVIRSMLNEPAYVMTQQRSYQGFDFQQLLAGLIKKGKRALEQHGDKPETKVTNEQLFQAQALLNEIRGVGGEVEAQPETPAVTTDERMPEGEVKTVAKRTRKAA